MKSLITLLIAFFIILLFSEVRGKYLFVKISQNQENGKFLAAGITFNLIFKKYITATISKYNCAK